MINKEEQDEEYDELMLKLCKSGVILTPMGIIIIGLSLIIGDINLLILESIGVFIFVLGLISFIFSLTMLICRDLDNNNDEIFNLNEAWTFNGWNWYQFYYF